MSPPPSSGAGVSSEVFISPGAVVCKESILVGEITIGARTVVHPKAVIKALDGPILIGENNLIEDQARIINGRDREKRSEGAEKEAEASSDRKQSVMIIGNHNVFEVSSIITVCPEITVIFHIFKFITW